MARLSILILTFLVTSCIAIPWVPAPKDEEWWMDRHNEYVQNTNLNGENITVVFFGDSITQGWSGAGIETWEKYYSPLGAANYGIGGDLTENVLWRIQNGEVEGLHPKLCVLKIGTNNIGSAVEDIARGVTSVTDALRSKLPSMKVLLLGILPRDNAETVEKIDKINSMIAILDNGNTIRFFNMRESFYLGGGALVDELFDPDRVHLSSAGYVKWAEVMDPIFREMLG